MVVRQSGFETGDKCFPAHPTCTRGCNLGLEQSAGTQLTEEALGVTPRVKRKLQVLCWCAVRVQAGLHARGPAFRFCTFIDKAPEKKQGMP